MNNHSERAPGNARGDRPNWHFNYISPLYYRIWILCLGHWQDLAYCLIDETDQSVWITMQSSSVSFKGNAKPTA